MAAYDGGHSAILIGLLIGAVFGIISGVGYAVYTDYSDNNSIDGSVWAESYIGTFCVLSCSTFPESTSVTVICREPAVFTEVARTAL